MGRLGILGLLGLPVLILGVAGLVAGMNYDKWFNGAGEETIGPNQLNAMMGAAVVVGLGVFLTILGLVRARSSGAQQATELEAEPAPASARETAAPPPVRVEIPAREEEPEAAPEPPAWTPPAAPEPAAAPRYQPAPEAAEPPAWTPPAAPEPAAAAPMEEEEEAGELDLAPQAPPPAPAAAAAAAPAPSAERDELEDLFGELESEVAKAEEDAVHYECPNCHGIVGEDDTTCPHCGVNFEG